MRYDVKFSSFGKVNTSEYMTLTSSVSLGGHRVFDSVRFAGWSLAAPAQFALPRLVLWLSFHRRPSSQMSAAVFDIRNSENYFLSEVQAAGLSSLVGPRGSGNAGSFKNAKIMNMERFAFCTGSSPDNEPEGRFVELLKRSIVLDETELLANLPALQALRVRCYVMSAQSMHDAAQKAESSRPVTVPAAERKARWQAVVSRHKPALKAKLEHDLCIAHGLFNAAAQWAREDKIKYIPLAECISRRMEEEGTKAIEAFVTDDKGFLKQSTKEICEAKAQLRDASGNVDIRQVEFAFQRLGLALEAAGICTYEELEPIWELYIESLEEDVPAGDQKTSLDQVLRADKKLWYKVEQLTTNSGVRPAAPGSASPVAAALAKVIKDSRWLQYLAPLEKKSAGQASTEPRGQKRPASEGPLTPAAKKAARKKTQRNNQKDAAKAWKAHLAGQSEGAVALSSPTGGRAQGGTPIFRTPQGQSGAQPGGGGYRPQGPPNGPGRNPVTGRILGAMPASLIGKSRVRTKEGPNKGEPFCFGYNLANNPCSAAAPGQKCNRGWHLCMEPGCELPHPCHQHARAEACRGPAPY